MDEATQHVNRVSYYVPVPGHDRVQYRVHRGVFQAIFAVGWRRIGPRRRSINFNNQRDGRKGHSGRKHFHTLRQKIEKFWLHDVSL